MGEIDEEIDLEGHLSFRTIPPMRRSSSKKGSTSPTFWAAQEEAIRAPQEEDIPSMGFWSSSAVRPP